jgi:hypothetical protein
LLFLFSTLESILLLCGQGGTKTWEAVGEGRLGTRSRDGTGGTRPGIASLSSGRAVGDANLWNKKWFPRIANASNKLSKRLVIWLLLLLDQQLGRKEASLIPIMHLKA